MPPPYKNALFYKQCLVYHIKDNQLKKGKHILKVNFNAVFLPGNLHQNQVKYPLKRGFPSGSVIKNPPANTGE